MANVRDVEYLPLQYSVGYWISLLEVKGRAPLESFLVRTGIVQKVFQQDRSLGCLK